MELKTVFSTEFAPYGRVLRDLPTDALIDALRAHTEKPADGVAYVPSVPQLEALPVFRLLQDSVYGGMPIQIGCCNGTNTQLGCVEYHRDSEVNVTEDEMVFLVAKQQDLVDGVLDAAKVEAFRAPAGAAVELYATTLHYAPCDGKRGGGFRVAVVLPRGTNTEKPALGASERREDALLWARNKWLLAHADSTEAAQGAFVGLTGKNPDIADDI